MIDEASFGDGSCGPKQRRARPAWTAQGLIPFRFAPNYKTGAIREASILKQRQVRQKARHERNTILYCLKFQQLI